MRSTTISYLAILATTHFGASLAAGTKVIRGDPPPTQTPSTLPIPGAPTSHGCYSSGGNLTRTPVAHMSSGSCKVACMADGAWVFGLHGNDCLCGYAYPPKDDAVKDEKCSYPCPSYPLEACGGLGEPSYYSIFNSGINIDVPDYSPPEKETKTSSSAKPTSTTTSEPQTSHVAPVFTRPPEATTTEIQTSTATPKESTPGPNIPAIVAGVVVGVVLVAAMIGGGFLYMRRKRNAEIEEEHRRNAAVNAFISGSKPPSSNGSISMTDSRLDPVLAHRRLSDGSIADNQDYSRKILRVTNA